MKDRKLIIGIVGSVCPLAIADIYSKAIKQKKFSCAEVDLVDIIIGTALKQRRRENQFEDASPKKDDQAHQMLSLYQAAKELKKGGVDKILIPNFLHYSSVKSIRDALQMPVADNVGILIATIKKRWPRTGKIGLLTTCFAMREKVFEEQFSQEGLDIIYPDKNIQENAVMEALYGAEGVTRGHRSRKSGELIRRACEHLFSKGADIILSGMTELPLIERQYYPQKNYLDCNEALAENLISDAHGSSLKPKKRGTIGILGGLGPAATVDLFDKIVKNTPACCDQDHLKIVIENNPQIPDRTGALAGKNEDPSVAMLATAEKLKDSGADFIIVPCNTAHVFLPVIQQYIKTPILSMIEETADFIVQKNPDIKRVGLLATSGTVGSGVYKAPLKRKNIELLIPSANSQTALVMEAIYGKKGIKAGFREEPKILLLKAAEELVKNHAELIILGCTEIPLVLTNGDMNVPFIDPTEILAKAAVKYAMTKSKIPCLLDPEDLK
ncbi:MAG: amino acid racemase [Lentisphaeria bacterium]